LSVYKYSLVKVPQGAENYWVGVLEKESILFLARLDCLYLFDPLIQ
jgi:hypothetical protein